MASTDRVVLSTLTEGLGLCTVEELKKLLKLLPEVEQRPTRKADFVKTIAKYLKGDGLKTIWDSLNELQKAVVAEAVYVTEGIYEAEQFRAKYGELPEWGSRSSSWHYNRPAAKLDLFFYRTSGYYGSGSTMPNDLQAKLSAFVPRPKKLFLKNSEELPEVMQVERQHFDYQLRKLIVMQEEVPVVCCVTERTAQQDLLAILRFVHLGKVSVSDKTLMPSKATIKEIAALLQGGDYYTEADSPSEDEEDLQPIGAIKPFAWPMILQAGGLAKLEGKKLQLTAAGKKALSAEPAKTIKAIWKKWLNTKVLDELRRIDVIKGQTGKGKRGLTAVDKRRSAIAQLLMDCEVGKWIHFDHLKRYAIASYQTFEVSRNPENLYIGDSGYGNLYSGNSWTLLESAYMRCFLFEYAATMGLLDVAYISPYDAPEDEWSDFWGTGNLDFISRYDGLLALRLNPLGAFCLQLSAIYNPSAIATKTNLRVLPNLDIAIVGQPLSVGENLIMETFALKTSDAVWKLDRDTILKATANGHSLKEFQEFLTQASTDDLPDTVKHFFKDCLSRSNSLQDKGLAKLIECTDATLATLIANDSRTKKYCYLAGERHLVVAIADETRFRNAVRKLGYILPLS